MKAVVFYESAPDLAALAPAHGRHLTIVHSCSGGLAGGWHNLRPGLRAEPYVFAAGDRGTQALTLLNRL